MNIDTLNTIVNSVKRPTNEQIEALDTILEDREKIQNILRIVSEEDIPCELRLWCWNLLFVGTLPEKDFWDDPAWAKDYPEPFYRQARTLNVGVRCITRIDSRSRLHSACGEPEHPGVLAEIPPDSTDHLWELLHWCMVHHNFYTHCYALDTWPHHIITGALAHCLKQSPNNPHYQEVVKICSGKKETDILFEIAWSFMVNPEYPELVRRNFASSFLAAWDDKLWDHLSSFSGCIPTSPTGKYSGTTRFAAKCAKGITENDQEDLTVCKQMFYCRHLATGELNFLTGMIHHDWTNAQIDILCSVYPEEFKSILHYVLTNEYDYQYPLDDRSEGNTPPSDLPIDFLLHMRCLVQHVLGGEVLLTHIDELLTGKPADERSREQVLRVGLENARGVMERSEQEVKTVRAVHSLVAGAPQEETTV